MESYLWPALAAASAKHLKHLTASERGQLVLNRIFSILFIAVGILLALV